VSILTGKKMYASKVECWRQNTPSFTLEALGRETAALSFVTSLRIAKPRHMPLFDFLRRGQSTQDAPQHLLRPTYLLKLIAVFFLYLIAGKLGLSMPFTSGNVSPVWPASGIALAAVLLWGSGVWPGIAAGAFLVNFWTPVPAQAALGIALGNTSGALVGGYLLRRFADSQFRICRLRDLADLIFLGALVSTSVAATLGTTTLFLAGVHAWSDFGTAWRVWWFGDAMGVLVVAPLLLTAREVGRIWQARAVETLLLFLGTTVTSLAIFSRIMGLSVRDDVLAFAVFPFVIWGAIRFRSAGAASVCFVIAVIAVWGTGRGFGPFVSHSTVHNAVLLQLFLAVISITALTLSAVMSERTQAEYALRKLSGRLLQLRDEERRRMARELHDSAGQMLVALQMHLSAVQQRISGIDSRSFELLIESASMLDQVINEIRTISYLLHPPLLDEAGLSSALQWYVDGLVQRNHMAIDLQISPNLQRLSQEIEIAIFRIVQECLTNVHRHSGSNRANIHIGEKRSQLLLTVRDYGKGISSELLEGASLIPASSGAGLRGKIERVRELGGEFQIQPASPGTIVQVVLPAVARADVDDLADHKETAGRVKAKGNSA